MVATNKNKTSLSKSLLTWLAQGFSVLFHPGFLITYFLFILLAINPYLFGISSAKDKGLIIIYVVIISVVFPLIPVVMMYALGLSKSIQLKKQSERTIPIALTGIFYLWLYINMLNNQAIPQAFNFFILGSVITLFTCFFINLFNKISLHTAGIGGLLAGVFIAIQHFGYDTFMLSLGESINFEINTNLLLLIVIIIAGIIGTSRLILDAHKPQDIYGGYLVGIASQIIAMRVLLY